MPSPAAPLSTWPSRRALLQGAAVMGGALALDGCQVLPPAASPAAPLPPPRAVVPGALEVRDARFVRDGKPFFVSGLNHWAATTLARDGDAAGWDRVRRDLDALQAAGVNVIRTMAATEGPDSEPLRIVPSIQPAAGRYDAAGIAGVLRVADELERRGLLGIFVLNNFWPWSGGFAQYVAWTRPGPIPYPPPMPGGSWDRFERFSAGFYDDEPAVALADAYLRYLVPQLAHSRAVIWELANEPRGMRRVAAYRRWLDATARLIKSLAPGQLVTTGSEGRTLSPWYAGLDPLEDHASPAIDFACFHMWAQNWGWIRPDRIADGFPRALDRARQYVGEHAALAARLGKPILLEEFGFPRDGGSFDPTSPTRYRDQYFEAVYDQVASLIPSTPLAGIMPWAWAGAARPPRPGGLWKPGDPLTGDPPHEQQGWYSIYDRDTTVAVIAAASPRITGA